MRRSGKHYHVWTTKYADAPSMPGGGWGFQVRLGRLTLSATKLFDGLAWTLYWSIPMDREKLMLG